MIVYAAPHDRALAAQIAQQDEIIGLDILARLGVYGCGTTAADFWLLHQENADAVLCRENGVTRIACPAPERLDTEEIAAFLAATGGFCAVMAEAGLCARLYPGETMQSAPAMRYVGGFSGKEMHLVHEGISLDALYRLLFPDAPAGMTDAKAHWYAYTSHLFRHGLGFAVSIDDQGVPVSTGGVYAWSETAGLIGCIATDPAHQHRGYGGQLVRYLCDRVLAEGKIPLLLCAEEPLAAYYAQLGFVPFGRWGRRIFSSGSET